MNLELVESYDNLKWPISYPDCSLFVLYEAAITFKSSMCFCLVIQRYVETFIFYKCSNLHLHSTLSLKLKKVFPNHPQKKTHQLPCFSQWIVVASLSGKSDRAASF